MGTQWRASMGGVLGLDYNALPAVMKMMAIPKKEWAIVFDHLRVFESVALSHFNKQKK